MDLDIGCGDFLVANKSSRTETGLNYSCDNFLKEFQKKPKALVSQNASAKCETVPGDFMSSSSLSSSISSGLMSPNYSSIKEPPMKTSNISYELAVAKSVMQQLSSISGDNLFDHLSDIIKRVIDERPPNVIDFFEEFSRNVRMQKLHLPENFPPDAVFEENRLYKEAKQQLISMKLPYSTDLTVQDEDELEEEHIEIMNFKQDDLLKFRTFNDRVQYLQFYWNQCGFSITSEDIFQLACSMNRLQTHPSIAQCRFWGNINGLKASYFIVEATLTKTEYELRLLQMENEIIKIVRDQNLEEAKNQKLPTHIGPELTPGAVGWENHCAEEISKMKPQVLPVPLAKKVEIFDLPPEPIGKGVNRYSYFVVNSLSDEWIELPIVTPKQISVSRDIKKFFTGDLEETIVSYPCFNGKEKHYLRAMITRITAGTYIAPHNYYRKMTKKERSLFDDDYDDNDDDDDEEEEPSQLGEDEEDEEQELDNDIVLLKNEKYDSSIPLSILNNPEKWVHVRPNILKQGRVVWYNQEKQKPALETRKAYVEEEEEVGEDESDYSEESDEEQLAVNAEKGPAILTSCSHDISSETSVAWVGRFTSKFFSQNERILVMQSKIWPGACTFIFKDLCESIYLGWGHKTVSRNIAWKHLRPFEEEYKHKAEDFIEINDPSVAMEEAYKLNQKKLENVLKFTPQEVESSDDQGDVDDEEEYEDEDDDDE